MNYEKRITDWFDESIDVILKSKVLVGDLINVTNILLECLENDHKIIVMGNGGSAADAQHLVAELIGRYRIERKSLPAISLTTDTSIITAIGNDYNFDYIFARQCESLVNQKDVIIAISTSGNSENIIQGIKTSKQKGGIVIGLTGNEGGKMKEFLDAMISVPSQSTPRIQECHRLIMHILCEFIDEKFSNLK
jgi:D-sedoheptulose 7-phosphate isomerase|tara:strand:- start:49 stop:627 length:579 start_codon:yes stop_codon:yes gene_type:complete